MWILPLGFHPHLQSKSSKLITVYILMFLSVGFTSCQRNTIKHHVNSRNSEINPFWYVGRGVRPIGRFGKRQLKFGQKKLRPVCCSSALILSALQEQDAAQYDGYLESF